MARIRSIKPEFPSDEKLSMVSRDARLTFVLLMTQADDEGLILASPRQLLGLLYPFDESVTPALLRTWIDELVAADARVRWRMTTGGAPVLELPNWKKHQKIDKPTPSKIRPLLAPLAASSPNPPRGSSEPLATCLQIEAEAEREVEVDVDQGSGVVRSELSKGESTNAVDNSLADPEPPPATARSEPSEETAQLDAQIFAFLGAFYGGATEKRRVDVAGQMRGVLTRAGVEFEDGVVFAVDVGHLANCCLRVINRPPRDLDAAIVFLLKKLRDTYTETMSARTRQQEDVWQLEAK